MAIEWEGWVVYRKDTKQWEGFFGGFDEAWKYMEENDKEGTFLVRKAVLTKVQSWPSNARKKKERRDEK